MKIFRKNKNKFIDFLKDFKEQPKEYIVSWIKGLIKFINTNKLFCAFVLVNLINALSLRALTLGFKEVFLNIHPLWADFSFLVILGSFGIMLRPTKRIFYYLTATIVMTLICVINSSYYTFYTSFTSISLISTSKFITAVGDAVVENVLQVKDFTYLIVFAIGIIWYFKKYKKENKIQKRNKQLGLKTLVFGVVCALLFIINLTATDISRIVKQWNREYVVSRYGIYVYHVNDLIKSVEPKITSLFGYDEAVKTFREYFIEKENVKTNQYTNIYKGKNIIAIHAESIQSFVIGLSINGVEIAPNLTKLSQGGLYFDNFYSQVSVGTSSDTEFTLNTSLMPTNTGTAFVNYYNRDYVSIPKLLKEQGYYTFAMHGNNADYWNRRTMHKSLGYDHFYAKSEFIIDDEVGLGLSDKSFFRQALEKMKTIDAEHENYYGTFIMLSNHTPFSDVDKYGELDLSNHQTVYNEETGAYEEVIYPYLEDTKLGNYLKSVHYADAALGEFIQGLDEAGLLDDTVIVLYGDHDARLPKADYSFMYNYIPETNAVLTEEDEGYVNFDKYQYELNRKVPFIIWSKDGNYKGTNSNVMGMYDVMPTLGNMFGFSNEFALGHDIFEIGEDNIVAFPTGNWLTNKVYYNSQKEAYYALKNSVITEEYIQENSAYVNELLDVSNAMIVYDLIKVTSEEQIDETSFILE